MFFRTLLAAGIPLTLLAAACGGGGGDDGPAVSSHPQVPAGAPFVDQKGLKFKPNELTVKAGDKVYFTNSESAVHTVNVNGENESGTMKKNDVFEWTFADPGEYKITCDYHAQMKSTITVEAPAVANP